MFCFLKHFLYVIGTVENQFVCSNFFYSRAQVAIPIIVEYLISAVVLNSHIVALSQ